MEIAKGGWTFDRIRYQSAVERFARRLIDERRPFIRLDGGAARGARFNSDDAVYVRVESNYTEEEFMACPGLAIDAMLADAAKSDWWYANEKEHDSPEMEIADEETDD